MDDGVPTVPSPRSGLAFANEGGKLPCLCLIHFLVLVLV